MTRRLCQATSALVLVGGALLAARPASAQTGVGRDFALTFAGAASAPLPVSWQLGAPADLFATTAPALQTPAPAQATTAPPPPPFEYSDAYRMRAKIHKIASFATLPLVGTQLILGQSLYDNTTSGKKTAHIVIGTSIGVLFGVNTVTGVWNLVEARKDPNKRGLRLTHGLLMLAADAGFLMTTATAPSSHEHGGQGFESGDRAAHRAWAFTSLGLATAGYLIMLFGGHS